MEDLLKDLLEGRIDVNEAKMELERRLFGSGDSNIDPHRWDRTGVPEVILAEGKTDSQIFSIAEDFLERCGRAIVSRLDEERSEELLALLSSRFPGMNIRYEPLARFLVAHEKNLKKDSTGGRIGILTAGTSDVAVAMEAKLMAEEMGCEVMTFNDVGVAGVHRLMLPLREMEKWNASVLIVAAGREGALPTLVSGLTRIPVIGLPVSTGYGMHGKGETALFAMLQSCSPLAVVNIDAGFVAGAMAAKIANISCPGRE
jgi:NCAIR mutase (PurE)-related protein